MNRELDKMGKYNAKATTGHWAKCRDDGFCMGFQRGTCNKKSEDCQHKHKYYNAEQPLPKK